jgi:putative membrane protein
MRLLYWIATAIVAIFLTCFAVSNRAPVSLALWPLPFAIDLPLYLFVFLVLVLGFVLGTLAAWLRGARRRRELRQRGRRIAALERELAATQSHLPDTPSR